MYLKQVDLLSEKFPDRKQYPFNLEILQKTGNIRFDSLVTFFIGENGTGKSTLLEAIAEKCRINIWQGIERTRFKKSPYEKMLYNTIKVQWTEGPVPGSFFSSKIFQNFAQVLDEWASSDPGVLDYFGGKSLMKQSHGQSLMSFFKSRYKIRGLYLLDEPETALSPKSQLELVTLLKDMSQAGHAQFIIASHSPILLACPAAEILTFNNAFIEQIEYEETDYYKIYKDFLTNRYKYL